MSQIVAQYDAPLTEERIDISISGTLTAILGYSFDHVAESVPGNNQDRSEITTTFQIDIPTDFIGKYEIKFRGFIGAELVGHKVTYEERTAETTTLFDPVGRKNDPSYRRGKKEVEHSQSLHPTDPLPPLPTYSARQRSIFPYDFLSYFDLMQENFQKNSKNKNNGKNKD